MKAKTLNTSRRNLHHPDILSDFPGPSREDSCPGMSKNPAVLQHLNKIFVRLSARRILSTVNAW